VKVLGLENSYLTGPRNNVLMSNVKCQIKFVERIDSTTPLMSWMHYHAEKLSSSAVVWNSLPDPGSRRPSGSEFQVAGAATENARRP